MEFLTALWLPVLLSAVFVFIVSAIVHMVVPIHRGDYGKMPGEESVMGSMHGQGLEPGCYMFPCPDSVKEMGTPEMIAKYKQGPVGFLTVVENGPPAMGKNLLHWFVFTVVVAVFVAHVVYFALEPGAGFSMVFHMSALVAFLAHGLSNVTDSIWKGVPWSITLKFVFDGFLYAVTTGVTFAWLWPAAS